LAKRRKGRLCKRRRSQRRSCRSRGTPWGTKRGMGGKGDPAARRGRISGVNHVDFGERAAKEGEGDKDFGVKVHRYGGSLLGEILENKRDGRQRRGGEMTGKERKITVIIGPVPTWSR